MQIQPDAPRPIADEILRTLLLLGTALVVTIPAARDMHGVIGWLPLWLVGMPATAWLVARLVRRDAHAAGSVARRARPVLVRGPVPTPQTRRRTPRAPRDGAQRAA